MAYATAAHVKARAGYLGSVWTQESTPSITDVESFVQEVGAEIDAVIGGLGHALPEPESTAALALRGLNADAALLLALDASFPAGEGPAAATELQERVSKRHAIAWALLLSGKHPAIAIIDATSESSVPSATDFWSENPDYGRYPSELTDDPFGWPNPRLDPAVGRGMAL